MKTSFSFMRSVVARRILSLFLFCALLPIGSLAVLSLREMSGKLMDQTDQRLRHASKNVGMTVFQGLSFLQTEMEALALTYGNHLREVSGVPVTINPLPRDHHFLGLTVFPDRSGAKTLFGTPCPPPPRTEGSRKHLASGQAMVFVQRVSGAPSRVYMAIAAGGRVPEQGIFVGEIHPKHLRELIENATPVEGNFTILDSNGEPIYHSLPLPAEVTRRVNDEARRTYSGQFKGNVEGDTLLVHFRSIYLKAAFLSENWTVVVSQSKAEAFAAVQTFTRTFVLIIFLTLLVVSLLSIVHIRKNLVPLAKLKEGTQKISQGDFESRIEVQSSDEFEDLAHSFNAMSERLGNEFHALTETGRIVRSVLTGLEKENIVRTVLSNLQNVIPCETVGLTLMDPGGNGTARTYTDGLSMGRSDNPRHTAAVFTPEELRKLTATDESLIVESGEAFPGLLSPLPGKGALRYVLLPLFHKEHLAGVLAMGYGDGLGQAREDILRARQIADQVAVALANAGLLEELAQLNRGAMTALARAVDAKSSWTAGHSERVTELTLKIGRAMGFTAQELDLLQRGGLLHDIGKIGVPGKILDKQGKLTQEEFAIIFEHPEKGARILEPIPAFQEVIPIVAQHHERFDGKGYPRGLSGEVISLGARILAVADVYDAMSADRPYRSAFPRDLVHDHIEKNAGLQFDPVVVRAFQQIILAGDAASTIGENRPVDIAGSISLMK
jgi:putative nucleotidyltransferase with HDIG domain